MQKICTHFALNFWVQCRICFFIEKCSAEADHDKHCCEDHGPCGEGEGDCDCDGNDCTIECLDGLVCGKDNCPAGFPSDYDCCMKPKTCKAEDTDKECCEHSGPCGEGEGDCDGDDECENGLVCGKGNCPSGFPSDYDCCYEK